LNNDGTDFDPGDVIASEVIQHPVSTNENSLARQVALQILYEVDSSGHPVGEVMDQQLAYHQLSPEATAFLGTLVRGVLEVYTKLDGIIQKFAPEFPLNQVAVIDRNILRLAVYEIGVYGKTPIRVAIDEAVQLAHVYGADGSPRFINGVLGSIVRNKVNIQELLEENDA